MHGGVWNKSSAGAHEVRGLTLGIVGYGKIGSQVSDLAEAMGMRVIFHDIAHVLARGNARAVSFRELLETADVITLHVDGRAQNKNLLVPGSNPGGPTRSHTVDKLSRRNFGFHNTSKQLVERDREVARVQVVVGVHGERHPRVSQQP